MADQFSKMYDVERVGGDQRQRLAEMLRANALNTPQGQMVGNWYVKPSWTQNLAHLANTAVGVFGGVALDKERKETAARLLREMTEGVSIEPTQQQTIFNNLEQIKPEGQTAAPESWQQPQNEIQRFARQNQPIVDQTQMTPMVVKAQPQAQFRPLTEDEKLGKAMELAQVDPLAAQMWSARDAARQARLLKLEDLAEKRAWEEKQALRDQQFRREMAQYSIGNKQPGAPVAVMGPNGQPIYVSPSQAYGKVPAAEAKPLTEAQSKASVFQSQMVGASNQLNKLQSSGEYDPTSKTSQFQTGMAGGITNIAAPESAQQAKQAQDQWAEAYLRFKTGAAATAGEVEQNRRTFFPVFGDSEKTIKQKAEARKQAEQDIGIAAGRGSAKGVQPTSAPSSSNW